MTTAQEFWDGVKAEMPKVNVWVIRYDPEIRDEAFRKEVLELIEEDGFIGEAKFSPPDMYDGWVFTAEANPRTTCEWCKVDFATAEPGAGCKQLPHCNGQMRKNTAERIKNNCEHVFVNKGETGIMEDPVYECEKCGTKRYSDIVENSRYPVKLLPHQEEGMERLKEAIEKTGITAGCFHSLAIPKGAGKTVAAEPEAVMPVSRHHEMNRLHRSGHAGSCTIIEIDANNVDKQIAEALRKKLDFPTDIGISDEQILHHTEGTLMRWGVEFNLTWKRFVEFLMKDKWI